MNQPINIDIAWGGYYASVSESGEFTVFRLLDFNRHAYQAALYQQKFAQLPTLAEVEALRPFIGHAPIDSRGLLKRENLTLVGSKPLISADFEGYRLYLEAHDVAAADIDQIINAAINFSHQPPYRLQFEIIDNQLVIREIK